MLVQNILKVTEHKSNPLDLIRTQCNTFLRESSGFPVVKLLPTGPANAAFVRKVKVRKKKINESDADFNEAFEHEYHDIRQRSVIVEKLSDEQLIAESSEQYDPFYVFPTNGFKFLYTRNEPQFDIEDTLKEHVMVDLIKLTYHDENLIEGIQTPGELLIYNIPYYYGVRSRDIGSYSTLLSLLNV